MTVRGFWQGVALGSFVMAAMAMYVGGPERHPGESRGWQRRRRNVWRGAAERFDAIGRTARAMRP